MADLAIQKNYQDDDRGSTSIVKQVTCHILLLYPISLTERSYIGKNSGIIFSGMMPQDIPVTCVSCVKNFSIGHGLLKGGIVLALNDDTTK